MFKQISALLFLGLLTIKIDSICGDKIEDSKAQLENLKTLLKGAILSANDQLTTFLEDYRDYSNNVDTEGIILIETEDVRINSELTLLKELGQNYNLGSCLRGTESLLMSLPYSTTYYLRECITNTTDNAITLNRDSLYLVDVTYNRVNELEFQLGLCSTEACIEPILQVIESETVRLPEQVDIEVTRAQDLFEIYRVTCQECQNSQIADYTETANFLIQFIGECIDVIIST